jgi:hypothetical protein
MSTFIRDGVSEEVAEERWKWEATYKDGSTLKQFDAEGLFHQFKEIDQTKLAFFKMVNGEKGHVLIFEKGMKLIHFYINSGVVDSEGMKPFDKVYVYGYEELINGKAKKHFFVIPPDDVVVYTNDLDKVVME